MPERWCTVTVTDAHGRRYSVDVLASSTYDAVHLYATHARNQTQAQLLVPTKATIFEIATGDRMYTVTGAGLQQWIEQRRQVWEGPRGMLFRQRPMLEG